MTRPGLMRMGPSVGRVAGKSDEPDSVECPTAPASRSRSRHHLAPEPVLVRSPARSPRLAAGLGEPPAGLRRVAGLAVRQGQVQTIDRPLPGAEFDGLLERGDRRPAVAGPEPGDPQPAPLQPV